MSYLFLTADNPSIPTGGGQVAYQEMLALQELADQDRIKVLSRTQLEPRCLAWWAEPWKWDTAAYSQFSTKDSIQLAHLYSGTFSSSVAKFKDMGVPVTITCAAHDKDISREEHQKLGMDFPYPHLTEPHLWDRYSLGYRTCDVLICPGKRPAEICQRYGCKQRIEVIPHGCTLPDKIKPIATKPFVVGYLGAAGADKGLIYLLHAWKQLAWKDAVLLLAGKDSTSDLMTKLLVPMAGCIDLVQNGSIRLLGWVEEIKDFYEQISLFVAPSSTEGFNLEVLEAMAHGRIALCSDGAGAADIVPERWVFPARDVGALCTLLDSIRSAMTKHDDALGKVSLDVQQIASCFTWERIRERYKKLWKELLKK